MSDHDAEHCLARYFEVVRERPERFTNPPGDIYEILLDPARIEHARSEARRVRLRDGLPASDTRVGVLAEDPFLTVMRDAVRFADGSYGLYNRLIVPSGVEPVAELDVVIVQGRGFRAFTTRFQPMIRPSVGSGTHVSSRGFSAPTI